MRRLLPSLTLLALASVPAAAQKPAAGKIAVTWLGHATFEVVSPGGTRLLIDPFLTQNPTTPAERKKLDGYELDAILVSHSHFDHASDAAPLAKATKAKVIGVFEQIEQLDVPAEQKAGGNVGGTFQVGDVGVHLVPAVHSSDPGGRPVGFVLKFADGRSIYHTGDTWIFGDMGLIQEVHQPTILLFQAGGGPYNQDPATAARAVKKYFQPKVIVPMHYGTWPVLADEAAVKKAFAGDGRLRVMKPGETAEF
jgi:L-ascorbate metabolism protein UlaG (beta-lactamase superfamily)